MEKICNPTFEEFVKQVISPPGGTKREPFCPFAGKGRVGYCDVAYSNACLLCQEAIDDYENTYKEYLI